MSEVNYKIIDFQTEGKQTTFSFPIPFYCKTLIISPIDCGGNNIELAISKADGTEEYTTINKSESIRIDNYIHGRLTSLESVIGKVIVFFCSSSNVLKDKAYCVYRINSKGEYIADLESAFSPVSSLDIFSLYKENISKITYRRLTLDAEQLIKELGIESLCKQSPNSFIEELTT